MRDNMVICAIGLLAVTSIGWPGPRWLNINRIREALDEQKADNTMVTALALMIVEVTLGSSSLGL